MYRHHSSAGLMTAALAFLCWGPLSLYLRAIFEVPPIEIIRHRVVWSLVFTGLLLLALERMGEVRKAMSTRYDMLLLTAGNGLVGIT